ncbi:MAG: hypothetical protein HY282_16575 [Nitrospirae bacterium]|nr:hypothetical protein [Candidatus Manganitrophaceae bacterium]
MRSLMIVFRRSSLPLRWGFLAVGLILCLASWAAAEDITISEKDFGCVIGLPKVRNTFVRHADPAKQKEAMRILQDRVPDAEYPVGTILQLVPAEAMVKHPHDKFPNTNGWEFFALDLSEQGTKIRDRGDQVKNLSVNLPCLSCHVPAKKFDFVCEKGHGCAPLPFDDQKIAEIQNADPRCVKKKG